MDKNDILIVEDELNLGQTLQEYLQLKGYRCFLASTVEQALSYFAPTSSSIGIVLLDIGLPDGDGRILAPKIWALDPSVVILFLSAQNDPNIRLQGLELGAMDYITKPFQLKELMLRLRRIIDAQKKRNDLDSPIDIGPLKIWFKKYEVQDAQGNIIPLSHKECQILKMLILHQNQVVAREEMINEIWGTHCFPSNRTIDNYIVKLRKWSETDPQKNITIQSVRSIGYKLLGDFPISKHP